MNKRMRVEELVGMKFGKLTILAKGTKNKNGVYRVICECECGNLKQVIPISLRYGTTKSCGCGQGGPKKKNLLGERFGKLVVVKKAGVTEDIHREGLWTCKCDCGMICIKHQRVLVRRQTKSCGCYHSSMEWIDNKKHGDSRKRIYKIFIGMHKRCYNKKSAAYKSYGAKGVTVGRKWHHYEAFKKDMHSSYSEHAKKHGESNTSIHRVNGKLGYCKSNCVWATDAIQAHERNCVKSFIATRKSDGKEIISKNINLFAKKHNMTSSLIHACISGRQKTHKGWSFAYEENTA